MPGAESIPVEKAAAVFNMSEAGCGNREIERKIGIPESSVRDILKKHGRWGEIAERPVFARLRAEQQQVMEAAFRAGAAKLFERAFDEDKLAKASTYQLVIASSIATDKARLLAGESTQNISVDSKLEVQGLDSFCKLLSQSLLADQAIDVTPDSNTVAEAQTTESAK